MNGRCRVAYRYPLGKNPIAGNRMLQDLLRLRGVVVGRKHVATVMRLMGIAALYRHPGTT
jgi:putative transposase